MNNKAKHIKIHDPVAARITETEIGNDLVNDYDPIRELQEAVYQTALKHGLRPQGQDLLEAFVLTPDANNMLRDGIRFLSFKGYTERAQTFQQFATVQTSVRPQEEYLRDSIMGVIPRTPSGKDAPLLRSSFEGATTIKNFRYAGLVEVTQDDIRFDRLGKMSQIGLELGRSARMTEEAAVYADITTTANYTRNSTTNDNDVGANTQTLTFSGIGMETATAIISTAKDRKSGAYLGLKADTIIIPPRMEVPVKQLLLSGELNRTGASETRGMGTDNQYRGMIQNIIVCPWFGTSFQWALVDSSRMSYVFQRVDPFNVLQESMDTSSESWLVRNSTRYLVQGYFGTGFVDDRAWFFSDSTTTPTVS